MTKTYSIIFCIVLNLAKATFHTPPCGLYGQPPCQFLPAAPGCTPACAKAGETFCENVPDYPAQLIKRLIEHYDVRNMIVDETADEFHPYVEKEHSFHQFFPNFNGPTQRPPEKETGYTYGPPTHYGDPPNQYQTQNNYIYRPQRSGRYIDQYYNNRSPRYDFPYQRFYYNGRYRRSVNGKTEQKPHKHHFRNGTEKVVLETEGLPLEVRNRTRRQIAAGREQLCQIRTQFVQPQAALNRQGNWMYVVNDGSNQVTQLVKTEVCASNICSNLCQLPNGYNSRCEQKYVQKRLVALQTDGQRLYTDTFWFPSCCVCTISNLQ